MSNLNIPKEDIALLVGGAIAVWGTSTGNNTAVEAGLAIAFGGKALGSVYHQSGPSATS